MPPTWKQKIAVGLIVLGASSWVAADTGVKVWCQPQTLTNGSPVLFEVPQQRRALTISAVWFGHVVNFFKNTQQKNWYALAAIPLEAAPGIYELKVSVVLSDGSTVSVVRKLRVTKEHYPRIKVKVAKQFTQPSPEQLQEVKDDKQTKQKAFAAVTPERLWNGPFVAPVAAAVSDLFGTERVFNHEVQSRHQGLDYAAPAGTEVRAVNRGTVILAKPLFFEGSCVVIDHGQGLLSLYLHLSQIKVTEGQQVESGQVLGLSGASGRASGAHLHLAIRWQGVYLNPAILLKMKLPGD